MDSVIRVIDRMKDGKYNIEDLRGVIALGSLRPINGGTQTFVFDNVDKMSERCQNALLKFIEEPSDYNRFVFTAESKSRILPTVLSRAVIEEIAANEASDEVAEIVSAFASAMSRRDEYDALAAFSRLKDRQSLSEALKLLSSAIRDALNGESALSGIVAERLLSAADDTAEFAARAELNPNMAVITAAFTAKIYEDFFI